MGKNERALQRLVAVVTPHSRVTEGRVLALVVVIAVDVFEEFELESSVLYTVFPEREFFGLSQPGRVKVLDDGFTRFMPQSKAQPSKRDRFLTMNSVQQARALEAIMQLMIQPPRR